MLILALDTSGDVGSVALADGENVVANKLFKLGRLLGEMLPQRVEFLLKEQGISLPNVDAFAVGLGPGSFTSVRVGVTLAKTWAFALQKPLVGVSSLDVLALSAQTRISDPVEPLIGDSVGFAIATVVPTRRTEAIAAFYAPGTTIPIKPPTVLAHSLIVEQGRAALGLNDEVVLLLVGAAAETVQEATTNTENVIGWKIDPVAADVAVLAARRLANGEQDDPFTLAPLYVTPPPVRGPDGNFRTDIGPV